MKIYYCLWILGLLFSCRNIDSEIKSSVPTKITVSEFQKLIDSFEVSGSILVHDLKKDIYYSNDFEWAKKGRLPASTFKIPNSLVALETGVVENDQTMFKWNGEERALKIWEKDMLFRDAFHLSCVPCYQEIARNIGVARMDDFLQQMNDGEIKVESSTIDKFWLEGSSTINMFQQVDFLNRFYSSEFPISAITEKIMKNMMIMEQGSDYVLRGKTGWSIRNGKNNGWFVGYVESSQNVYFFAVNIEPKPSFNLDLFSNTRKEIAYLAFNQLSIF